MKKTILLSTIYFLLYIFLIPIICNAQSLGAERVKKLKESVVRVLIENKPSGTAFFVTQEGLLLSCWHVVEPAMIRDSSTNAIVGLMRLEIEFHGGEKVGVGIPIKLLQYHYNEMLAYDYVILALSKTPNSKFSFLKMGDFNNIKEGDAIYSNGYPLGIKQNFISTGVLSTKWVDTVLLSDSEKQIVSFSRNVAWLDLTMNKGNSGGPVVKLGNTMEDDEVIGIATFILNPFANEAGQLADFLSSERMKTDMIIGGISTNRVNELYAKAVANNSIGVSGCVSINHLLETMKRLNF